MDEAGSLNYMLAEHTKARLAVPADNADILKFFHRTGLKGERLAFAFTLTPDFASFHRLQGAKHLVFLLYKRSGELGGLATLSLRPAFVAGEEQLVGYFSDMRIDADRQVIKDWRFIFQQLLKPEQNFPELAGCRHFYCAVMADNHLALNAFAGRRRGVQMMQPFGDYRITHILGRRPGHAHRTRRRDDLTLRYAEASDLAALTLFLDAEQRQKAFGYCFGSSELAYRLQHWPGLSLASFLLALSTRGKTAGQIVGCVAPWSPQAYKRVVLHSAPWALRLVGGLMRLGRLPGYRHVPQLGKPVRSLFLTHLTVAPSSDGEAAPGQPAVTVMEQLIAKVYDDYVASADSQWQFLAFADFAPVPAAGLKRHYFVHTLAAKLLCAMPDAGEPSRLGAPALEMATV